MAINERRRPIGRPFEGCPDVRMEFTSTIGSTRRVKFTKTWLMAEYLRIVAIPRQGFRDSIHWTKPFTILGQTDTLDMAQLLCQKYTQNTGTVVDYHQWPLQSQNALHKTLALYQDNPDKYRHLARQTLTDIWKLSQPDPSAAVYFAYRTVQTATGPRIEFYPAAPQMLSSPEHIKHALKRDQRFTPQDYQLPTQLPQGVYLSMAPIVQKAWTIQGGQNKADISWTLIPFYIHGETPTWIAACQTHTDPTQKPGRFILHRRKCGRMLTLYGKKFVKC